MIKKILIFLCLCSPAWATTTITGNLKTLSGGSISLGTFVRFYLRGCSGNQPRINGTAIIGPTLGNVYYTDLVPNSSGAISGTLYSTTDVTGTGNGDIECGGLKTGLWYGFQPFLNGKAGPETPFAAKNTATVDISNITPLTANPVVASPTGDGTYLRLDGGNSPATGALAFSSSLTTQSLNGELQVGNGSGQYASIALCYAALAAGQGCAIPNNWSDPNWTANLVISKNHTYLRFMGDATMNMQTFSVTMASSVAGFKIVTPGNSEAASAGIRWLYTGTGSAFSIGDGTTSTSGIQWGGFTINTVSAGTSATCLTLTQVVFSVFIGVQCFGANAGTQVGILLTDGGGTIGTIDNTFINTRVTNVQKAIRFVPTSTGGVSNNTFQTVNIGTSVASNIGFDLQAASTGNDVMNADLNGLATAINIAAVSTVNNNRFFAAFLQNNTTDVSAGAGSHDNFVDPVGNVTVTISDSGTNNSFLGLTTQIKVGSGSIAKPSINIGGTSGFFNAAGSTVWSDGSFARHSFGSGAGNEIAFRSNGGILWVASGDPNSGTKDTGVARQAAGVVSADTTTVGNALGTFKAAGFNLTNLFASSTAPSIAGAGCGGSAATIPNNNGTAAFEVNVGTTPGSACTITMPTAAHGWACSAVDVTTNSTSVFYQKQSPAASQTVTQIVITNFSDVAAATAFTGSDVMRVMCNGY